MRAARASRRGDRPAGARASASRMTAAPSEAPAVTNRVATGPRPGMPAGSAKAAAREPAGISSPAPPPLTPAARERTSNPSPARTSTTRSGAW